MSDMETRLAYALMGFVAPLWLLIGLADGACHRALRIERTAGLRESRLHLLMLAELGVAILAALFLELNAASLLLIFGACLAHELTAWADLSYAEAARGIPWYEQWVHGLQQTLPWVAFGLLLLIAWPQALSIFRIGDEAADWSLRLKQAPLPGWYVAGFLAASMAMVIGPFALEWRRATRARR